MAPISNLNPNFPVQVLMEPVDLNSMKTVTLMLPMCSLDSVTMIAPMCSLVTLMPPKFPLHRSATKHSKPTAQFHRM